MELDPLFLLQRAHDEVDVPRPDPEPRNIVFLLGQVQDVELGVVIEPDVVALAEVDLGPAVRRADTVALADGHIEGPFLVAEVGRPLDEYLPFDETQSGNGFVRVLRIFRILGRGGLGILGPSSGRDQEKRDYDNRSPFHGHSPIRHLLYARTMPRVPPEKGQETGPVCPV